MRRATTLYLVFLTNLAAIVYFWFVALSGDWILDIGRLFGLLAAYFVLIQFFLQGRVRPFEGMIGHDSLVRIHRTTGKIAIIFVILHPLLISIAYSRITGKNLIAQDLDFFANYEGVIWAFIASILLVGVVTSSIAIVRMKLKYETWYFVHLMVYLAVLLAFGHQLANGGTFISSESKIYWYVLYFGTLGIFVTFRWLRPLWLFAKYRFRVEKTVRETHDTTSIYITGKNMKSLDVDGGKFAIYRFLDKKRWWQAHPFSLSRIPEENSFRITVKNSGDFTSEIQGLKKGTPVFVDGFYGIFTKKVAIRDKFLFLIGGVGITPVRGMLDQVVEEDCILLYANKTSDNIIFQKELSQLSKTKKLKVYDFLSSKNQRIDEGSIKKLVPDIKKRDIFICGPTGFMDAMIAACVSFGVKPHLIHWEKFALH